MQFPTEFELVMIGKLDDWYDILGIIGCANKIRSVNFGSDQKAFGKWSPETQISPTVDSGTKTPFISTIATDTWKF